MHRSFVTVAALAVLQISIHTVPSTEVGCQSSEFQRWIEDRKLIDAFQESAYGANKIEAEPQRIVAKRTGARRGVLKVVTNAVGTQALEAWLKIPRKVTPLAGFRAKEIETAEWKLRADLTLGEVAAAKVVQERLACDGLLKTAVAAVEALGEERTELSVTGRLARVGFPVDLLRYFQSPSSVGVLELIAQGRTEDLGKAIFKYEASEPAFEAAVESGQGDLKLARVELGGGVRDGGILPGSSLDVAGKLVEALPETRWLASVPQEFAAPVQFQALSSWELRRLNQLTLIAEPLPVAGWAQDNGKGGMMRAASGPASPAVMAPRYASIGEFPTVFVPGESLLLEGVAKEGVRVIYSPLLFQGGNLQVVRDPGKGQRLLLLSENEVERNLQLGLNREQIVEAFRVEFGVDRCVVVPMASYHLDYDVTCRVVDGELVALVNDPISVAREVMKIGAAAMVKGGFLLSDTGKPDELDTARRLSEAIGKARKSPEELGRLAKIFQVDAADSPSANLACLNVALDWLMCAHGPKEDYLAALSLKLKALAAQKETLEREGLKVVSIPSMPDLGIGINYLNGVHDRSRFVMPVYGGFYSELDRAVVAKVGSSLGQETKVIPIACGELQRNHGALHCMVSIFPGSVLP